MPARAVLSALMLLLLAGADAALAQCGSRGGPGYRDASGQCVGWDRLDRVCGVPPSTRCTFEGAGRPNLRTEADAHARRLEEMRRDREDARRAPRP